MYSKRIQFPFALVFFLLCLLGCAPQPSTKDVVDKYKVNGSKIYTSNNSMLEVLSLSDDGTFKLMPSDIVGKYKLVGSGVDLIFAESSDYFKLVFGSGTQMHLEKEQVSENLVFAPNGKLVATFKLQ